MTMNNGWTACDNPWCGMWGTKHSHPSELYAQEMAEHQGEDVDARKAFVTLSRRIGDEFTRILRSWLSDDEWAEMVRLNAAELKDSLVCHSHDHCDANMAMLEAFQNLGVKCFTDYNSDTQAAEHDAALTLCNATWDYAKTTWPGIPAKS